MSKSNFKKLRTKSKINYDYPVVIVHRSNKHSTAQILEPITKNTLVTINTYKEKGSKTDKSKAIGNKIGDYLNINNIQKVVFDRNGYTFSGRVEAIAAGIKEKNIII
jgi:large subunit ribosomal protein L18